MVLPQAQTAAVKRVIIVMPAVHTRFDRSRIRFVEWKTVSRMLKMSVLSRAVIDQP